MSLMLLRILADRLPIKLKKNGVYYFEDTAHGRQWRYRNLDSSSKADTSSRDYGCIIRCNDLLVAGHVVMLAFGLRTFGTASMGEALTSS